MTAEPDKGPDRPSDREDVGSLGEEAAKLLGVLSDWARERPPDTPTDGPVNDDQTPPDAQDDPGTASAHEPASGSSGLGEQLAAALHLVDEHVATGSSDCRYCPVCRVAHAVRSTSPEVREHLTSAAGSLLEAAAGLLATHVPTQRPTAGTDGAPRRPDGVQRIDLDPDAARDDEQPDGGNQA